MQRPTLTEMPIIRVIDVPLLPMYAWPIPVKRVVFGLGVILCIGVYAAMGAALISMIMLIYGLI
jgi:hypothetical protein